MSLPLHWPVASIVEGRRTTVNASVRSAVALVCAASAGVHAGLVPEHYRESPALSAAFAGSVLLLAAAGLGTRAVPATTPWAAGALLAVAACYLLSRTTGLPPLITESEPVDVVGALTTLAEVVAAVAALCLPLIGKERR